MRKTTCTAWAAVLAVALACGVSWAAGDKEEGGAVATKSGPYGTLGGIAAMDAYNTQALYGTETGWGLDTRLGWRFTPNLAAEAQYQFVPYQQSHVAGGGNLSVQQHALTANGKVYIFNGLFQPYLLFGFGFVRDGFSQGPGKTAAAIRVGGGAQVMFTEHFGIYGEVTYLKPFTTLGDFNTVPIAFGGTFQF